MLTWKSVMAMLAMSIGVLLAGCLREDQSKDPTNTSENRDRAAAAILNAANEGEVQVGQLADERATDSEVKAYACRMIEEHTATAQRQAELRARLGIAPLENPTSQRLRDDTRQTLDMLRTLEGAAFDRAYIESQVRMHAQVLDLLNNDLIPNSCSAEWRADLQRTRDDVANHLQEAQRIQTRIGPPSSR